MSDRKYYYLEKGKALGPVAESELVELIRQGRVFALDLVYFQDDVKWRPANEFPVFKEALIQASDLQKKEAQWVVLTKKDRSSGPGFVQSGPFGTSVVLERLAQGTLKYTDYVWKKGMKEWKKINDLPEFARVSKPPSIAPPENLLLETPPFPQESADVLLKSVVQKKQLEEVDEVPPEAGTEDLTQSHIDELNPAESSLGKRTARISPPKPMGKERVRRPPSNRFVWFAAFSLTVFAFGAYLLTTINFQKLRNETNPPPQQLPVYTQPPPQTYTPPHPTVVAQPTPNRVETAPAEPPHVEKIRPPTYVRSQFQDLQGDGAKIIVESDGNEAEIPVVLQFNALGGEVLEKRGVHKQFRRVLIHGRNEFPIRALHLPEGQMTVRVSLPSGIAQEKSFFFGVADAHFKERLKRHKKQVTFVYQLERQQLFQITSQVQSDLQDLQLKLSAKSTANWNSYSSSLMARLEKIRTKEIKSDAALENVSLWPDWLELRAIVQDTLSRLKASENAPNISSKDLLDRTNRLRSKVMKATLWRST